MEEGAQKVGKGLGFMHTSFVASSSDFIWDIIARASLAVYSAPLTRFSRASQALSDSPRY